MKVHTDQRKELSVRKPAGDCLCPVDRQGTGTVGDEKNIFTSGADWRDIFHTLTDMVTVHDNNFNIVGANAAARKVLGLPSGYAADAKCYEYYHGSECPPEGCPARRCLSTGKPATLEIYEPHLNMYVEIRAIPRYDSEKKIAGMVHIVREITRRKEMEEEIEIHRRHLEWLVRQRTAEISFANDQLRREIAERERVEAEAERLLRELRDLLQNSRH